MLTQTRERTQARRIGDVIETPETAAYAREVMQMEWDELQTMKALGYPALVIGRQLRRYEQARAVYRYALHVLEEGEAA